MCGSAGWAAAEGALEVMMGAALAVTGRSLILKRPECHTREFRLYPVQTISRLFMHAQGSR